MAHEVMIHDPSLYHCSKELADGKDLVCKIEAKAAKSFKLTYCLTFLLIFLKTVS
jgi:hypothetical protein